MGTLKTFDLRYAEDDDGDFSAWIYRGDGTQVLRGTMTQRPDWLVRIADLATVGGHLEEVDAPPPTRLFWCVIDTDGNLIRFSGRLAAITFKP